MTNILSLPVVEAEFEVATNEDWRDSIAFSTAGSITNYALATNVGNGALSNLAVAEGAYIGDYGLTLTAPTLFRVSDPDGFVIGQGELGIPFSRSGVSFTLSAGATAFVAGDAFVLSVLPQPLDITGIAFAMQMRVTATSANVRLSGSTQDGSLINGGPSGVLGFNFPRSVMQQLAPSPDGSPDGVDIVAVADGATRRCLIGSANVVRGFTYLPG